MCSIRIHQMFPAITAGKTKRAPGPLALFNSSGNHIIMLSFLTNFKLYLGKQKTCLLWICAKRTVLPLPSQKLWQIITSACLKVTKVGVRYYYNQGLRKHALIHIEITGLAGISVSRPKKTRVASIIISWEIHPSNSVHTTEECKNKAAIQQQ